MQPVRFSLGDAWLLWLVPHGGCDLGHVLRGYVYVARDAVPSFDRVRACLSRAARSGVLLPPTGGRFELAAEWEERFVRIVGCHTPSECGILELDEFLAAGEWPQVGADFALSEDEYRQAAGRVQHYHDGVFGRRT